MRAAAAAAASRCAISCCPRQRHHSAHLVPIPCCSDYLPTLPAPLLAPPALPADCPYKHTTDTIKECNMYKLGFCIYGPAVSERVGAPLSGRACVLDTAVVLCR